MPGPKTQTKPKMTPALDPALMGLTVTPLADTPLDLTEEEQAAYRDLTVTEMLGEGESMQDVIARQATEGLHASFVQTREAWIAFWAPRLGMTKAELLKMSAESPYELQERLREAWDEEETLRDSGLAADQTDSLGYRKTSAEKMLAQYRAGALGEAQVPSLARALVPMGLMGRFTPMLDPVRNDGFVGSISLIQNAEVPKKRKAGYRFLTEPRRDQGFVPEPTIKCEMRDGFGAVCEKYLYTEKELLTHQQRKHNSEWYQGVEAQQQQAAKTVADAQVRGADAMERLAQALERQMLTAPQPVEAEATTAGKE